MGAPTLMFCAGATKAGTGWLFEYLRDHPDCHLRSIKELHYFSSFENGTLDREIAKHKARQDALSKKAPTVWGEARSEIEEKLRDRTDWLGVLRRGEEPETYLAYLNGGRTSETVVGDLTPAYALLSQKRLRAMAGLVDTVRFVYLVRDPVNRLWSHVRMIAARRSEGGRLDPERAARILKRVFRGEEEQIAKRSNYAKNISRLRGAVGPRLKVAFFEELFEGDATREICDHLGIAHIDPAARVVHEGQTLDMTTDQRGAMRNWLEPQYEFIAETEGRLPLDWQS